MARAYFKLKDTGTTFYDVNQSKGLVADRVAELELTDNVRKAKSSGVIIEVSESEGKAAIEKQEADYETAEKARLASTTKEEVNLDSTSARVAIEGGVSTGDSNTLNFKDGDARTSPAGDTADFDAATTLEGNVSEVTASLSGLNSDQLNTLRTAEASGQNRKGVITAIDEQLGTSSSSTSS